MQFTGVVPKVEPLSRPKADKTGVLVQKIDEFAKQKTRSVACSCKIDRTGNQENSETGREDSECHPFKDTDSSKMMQVLRIMSSPQQPGQDLSKKRRERV